MPRVNYERDLLMSAYKSTLVIYEGMQVLVGDRTLYNSKDIELDINVLGTSDERRGKDMYVYACQPKVGRQIDYVLSFNATVPDGYTAENSRKIGGFHGLCEDVGYIADHALSGYMRGDILPYSVWDLHHRAFSENEGMVFVPETDLWWDIYLASYAGSGRAVQSVFEGLVLTGASDPVVDGETSVYYMANSRKRLPFRYEFMVAASGCPSGLVTEDRRDNHTGGYRYTNGRRMVSNCGLEDCTGYLWQWVNDLFEGGNYGELVPNQVYMDGYSWSTAMVGFNTVGDNGDAFGFLRRACVGGSYVTPAEVGIRCIYTNTASSTPDQFCAMRGVSKSRVRGEVY